MLCAVGQPSACEFYGAAPAQDVSFDDWQALGMDKSHFVLSRDALVKKQRTVVRSLRGAWCPCVLQGGGGRTGCVLVLNVTCDFVG